MSTTDFLPCPFCGQAPAIEHEDGFINLRCDNTECLANVAMSHRLDPFALQRWNTRAGEDGLRHQLNVLRAYLWAAVQQAGGQLTITDAALCTAMDPETMLGVSAPPDGSATTLTAEGPLRPPVVEPANGKLILPPNYGN